MHMAVDSLMLCLLSAVLFLIETFLDKFILFFIVSLGNFNCHHSATLTASSLLISIHPTIHGVQHVCSRCISSVLLPPPRTAASDRLAHIAGTWPAYSCLLLLFFRVSCQLLSATVALHVNYCPPLSHYTPTSTVLSTVDCTSTGTQRLTDAAVMRTYYSASQSDPAPLLPAGSCLVVAHVSCSAGADLERSRRRTAAAEESAGAVEGESTYSLVIRVEESMSKQLINTRTVTHLTYQTTLHHIQHPSTHHSTILPSHTVHYCHPLVRDSTQLGV